MGEQLYAPGEAESKRIAIAVRTVEGNNSLGGGTPAVPSTAGLQIIYAQLTTRDGTDPTKYTGWTQQRRKSDGTWQTPHNALTDSSGTYPVFDIGNNGSLVTTHVAIARGVFKDGDGKIKPCWYVVGFPWPPGAKYQVAMKIDDANTVAFDDLRMTS